MGTWIIAAPPPWVLYVCVSVCQQLVGVSLSPEREMLSSRAGLHPTRANEELGCRVGAQVQVSVEPNPPSGV